MVNGVQVTRAVLRPGDVIMTGRVFFSIDEHHVPESWDADPWAADVDLEDTTLDQPIIGSFSRSSAWAVSATVSCPLRKPERVP